MVQDLIEQGLQQHNAGRLPEATILYKQALAINPRHPDALHLLGLAALQTGDPEEAATLIKQAAELRPANWAFQSHLAMALFELRRFEEAQSAFRQAARLNPDEPQLAMGIANCMAMRGELREAETQLRKLIRRRPGYALAWFNLGNAVRDQERVREAVELYRRAIQLDANLVEAHNNLGTALLSLGKLDGAEQEYRRAVAIQPDDAVLHCNLASVLIDRGKFSEAETTCRTALALQPRLAIAVSIMGSAIGHQGRLSEALEYHRKAAELEPENLRAVVALGSALHELGALEEGLAVLGRAVALAPDSWQARAHLAIARLSSGDFHEGWRDHVYRSPRELFQKLHPDVALTTTLPSALAGRHLRLQQEQGLGDQLFFLRFLPAIKARGARITCRSTAKIASILARVPAIDRVIPDTEELPAADYTLMIGDLPLAASEFAAAPLAAREDASRARAEPVRDFVKALPRAARAILPVLPRALALTPLEERLIEARAHLARLGNGPYIGITWRGGTVLEEQRGMAWALFKQVPLEGLAGALRGVDGTLLSLQRNPLPGETEGLAGLLGRPVHDLSPLNEDLEAMLALLALIDDYVGVSNTNMHLRAGVGRTARVLVPCPPEWRWMSAGDESPWFPGFRIYRQELNGNWTNALDRLARDMRASFGAR